MLNGLVKIGDGFFKSFFVMPDTAAIDTRFYKARIDFDGAIEVRQRSVHVSGEAMNRAAIIPGLAQARIEHNSAIRVRHRSTRISYLESGAGAIAVRPGETRVGLDRKI